MLMPRSVSISPKIGSFFQRFCVIQFITEMEHLDNDHQTLLLQLNASLYTEGISCKVGLQNENSVVVFSITDMYLFLQPNFVLC